MELRKYREEDLAALARLGTLAFGAGVAYWEDYYDPGKNPRLDPDLVYVIEEDGEPRATATVLPMEIFVDGEPRPMGGVAAVNTHPAYRRRGFAGKLMRAALDGMRERGMRLSMLSPFAHPFYRAHGYELATEAVKYTLSPADLSTSAEQSRVRVNEERDLPQPVEARHTGNLRVRRAVSSVQVPRRAELQVQRARGQGRGSVRESVGVGFGAAGDLQAVDRRGCYTLGVAAGGVRSLST